MNQVRSIFIVACVLAGWVSIVSATNFKDEIGRDSDIKDELEYETNIKFILQKGKAAEVQGRAITTNGGGAGNVNIGPGTDLTGAVIINNAEIKGSTIIDD